MKRKSGLISPRLSGRQSQRSRQGSKSGQKARNSPNIFKLDKRKGKASEDPILVSNPSVDETIAISRMNSFAHHDDARDFS